MAEGESMICIAFLISKLLVPGRRDLDQSDGPGRR